MPCTCDISDDGAIRVWCETHYKWMRKEQLAEREACAKLIEAMSIIVTDTSHGLVGRPATPKDWADLIRSRRA